MPANRTHRSSTKSVGAILVILPEHAEAADELFRAAGFIHAEVRIRADGKVEFVFGKEVERHLWRLFNTVPEEFHAFGAMVGGVPPGLPNFE